MIALQPDGQESSAASARGLSEIALDEPTQVVWTKLAIIGVPGMECQVRTTADGGTCGSDGDPLPMNSRPRVCGGDSRWMLGDGVFMCQEHAREVARLMDDDIEEIERVPREMPEPT